MSRAAAGWCVFVLEGVEMKRRSAFTLEAVVVHYRRELLTAKNGSARICAGMAPPVNDLYRYAYTLP